LKNAFQVETCQIETTIGLQICTIKPYWAHQNYWMFK
jgi:hypothetical protein